MAFSTPLRWEEAQCRHVPQELGGRQGLKKLRNFLLTELLETKNGV